MGGCIPWGQEPAFDHPQICGIAWGCPCCPGCPGPYLFTECPLSPLCLFQRLVAVLKMAAASVKKESKLPAVALDLLRLALQENKFPRFWKEVVEQGLLKKQFWPARCVRCLSAPRSLFSVKEGWTWGPEIHPGALRALTRLCHAPP